MSQATRWLVGTMGAMLLVAALALALAPAPRAFDVQGHRGARGYLPENTLPAFARGQQLGVTTLELDTKVTADGVLVITHDSLLNPDLVRDSSGQWVADPGTPVFGLTLAQLGTYDVGRIEPGTAYAARIPEQQPIDGTRIPTLSALFDQVAASGDGSVRFNIETKIEPDAPELSPTPEAFARMLVNEVRNRGLQDRVTIQSFDWRTLAEVQRIAPMIPTVALTESDEATLDGTWTAGLRLTDYGGSVPRLVAASGATTWSPNFTTLTTATVSEAHDLGLRVVPWTVNNPADIQRMLDFGVDGVISDYPDRVVAMSRSWSWMALHRVLPVVLAVGGILFIVVAIATGRRNPQ